MSRSNVNYPALEIISGFYKVLAWIVAIFTVISSIFIFVSDMGYYNFLPYGIPRIFIVIANLILGGLSFISLLGISEIIKVFLNIEQNTRKLKEM